MVVYKWASLGLTKPSWAQESGASLTIWKKMRKTQVLKQGFWHTNGVVGLAIDELVEIPAGKAHQHYVHGQVQEQ